MRYLSLFSGIEAASVAWHPLGWECVGVSEIEPFPCAVLAHHYPNAPNLGDVTKITEQDIAALGPIDLVVFGSPCQDLSVAGHRKGLIDAHGNSTRSGLFFTAINIVNWARKHGGCRLALWENVPGAFSSSGGKDFAAVVEWMAGLDEVPVPAKGWGTEGVALGSNGLLEWATLDAQWFGVAQRRRRVFALADFGNWSNRPPILLEPESLRGDSAPRREAGEEVAHATAPFLTSSGRGVERTGETQGQDPVVAVQSTAFRFLRSDSFVEDEYVGALAARDYKDARDLITHTLRGEGFDSTYLGNAEGGALEVPFLTCHNTGGTAGISNQTPLVGVSCGINGDVAGTLDAHYYKGPGSANFGERECVAVPAIAFHPTQDPISSADGSTHAMGCGSKNGAATVAVAVRTANTNANGHGISEELAHTLDQAQGQAVASAMQVRRLTPVECERLQGFPDGWTDIKPKDKPTPDGPRYKALGNSMAVPVMRWIGTRIKEAVE